MDAVLGVRDSLEPVDAVGLLPTGGIPSGVRLAGYTGDDTDLPPAVLQQFRDAAALTRTGKPPRDADGRTDTIV
ncbi:hypothetical protein [Nocardioides pantholopis]|uniref:hypothetical protein n=1 Tax=Nocardioides pantholopis TaxID=2483798 RepID=UPI000F07EDAE|nr:hypothetical protein [Nocardioides pantholopis]